MLALSESQQLDHCCSPQPTSRHLKTEGDAELCRWRFFSLFTHRKVKFINQAQEGLTTVSYWRTQQSWHVIFFFFEVKMFVLHLKQNVMAPLAYQIAGLPTLGFGAIKESGVFGAEEFCCLGVVQ